MTDPFAVPSATRPYREAPPPGYRVPVLAGEPRKLRGLAVATMTLIGLATVAILVSGVGLLLRAAWADRVLAGGAVDADEASMLDGLVLVPVAVSWLLYLPAGIVMIVWQYRHATNAQILGQNQGLSAGWAIGGWFIPYANVVLPAVQLFGSSRYSHAHAGPDGTRRGTGAKIVIAWAIAFPFLGIAMAAPLLSELLGPDYAATLEELAAADLAAGVVAILFGVTPAVLAVLMVWRLTGKQEAVLPFGAFLAWPVPSAAAPGYATVPAPWTAVPSMSATVPQSTRPVPQPPAGYEPPAGFPPPPEPPR